MSSFKALKETQSIKLVDDEHGLCLLIESAQSKAKVSLFGAHCLSFISNKDGLERLWLSNKATFDGKTAIRGGIPICWPWFGAHSTQTGVPNHGFVRSQKWQVTDCQESSFAPSGKANAVTICLRPEQLGLYNYSPLLHVSLKFMLDDKLSLELHTENLSEQSIQVSQALHSYFYVPDIEQCVVQGINDVYYDKVTDTHDMKCPEPYTIAAEVDRIHATAHQNYSNTQTVNLMFQGSQHKARQQQSIIQSGHDSVVIWNPWQALSRSMTDMADDGYRSMLCVEAANTQGLTLLPGQSHVLKQVIY